MMTAEKNMYKQAWACRTAVLTPKWKIPTAIAGVAESTGNSEREQELGCACKAEIQPSAKAHFLQQNSLIKELPWMFFFFKCLGDEKQMALIS